MSGDKQKNLDQSDMIGSSGLNRLACSIFAVNTSIKNNNQIKNTGVVENVKNWFGKADRFKYTIEDIEGTNNVCLFYDYDIAIDLSKKDIVKNHIRKLIKDDPSQKIFRKELEKSLPASISTIKDAIKELKSNREITRHGATKDCFYSAPLDTSTYQPNKQLNAS